MKYRPEFGLAFAGAHLAHLAMILWLASLGGSFPPIVVGVGGFGFVLLTAMAITSFPATAKAIGAARWRLLHRVGIHYIAGIFAYDWLTRLGSDPIVYAPLALLLAGAYVLGALSLMQ